MTPIVSMPTAELGVADASLPQPGEAVVILSRDGTARMLTIAMSPGATLAKMKAGEPLTEEEENDVALTGKAFALTLAANTPQIMEIIEDIASNPEIVDPAVLAAMGKAN